jgi:hypothetical protein
MLRRGQEASSNSNRGWCRAKKRSSGGSGGSNSSGSSSGFKSMINSKTLVLI